MFTIRHFLESTRGLLKNPRALTIFAGLYALLLATLYGFAATREATVWQVLLTLFFLVLIPAEFFLLQAAIVDHTRGQGLNWRPVLRDACKLFVVTLPIILLGYALFVLLNKWQVHFPQARPRLTLPTPPGPGKPEPLHGPTLLFATARGLLFGIALPLTAIHLWLEVAGRKMRALIDGGAPVVIKRFRKSFARAFAPEAVMTYGLGAILFAVVPYALLFVHIPVKGTRTEFAVFIARLLLAFVFTLVGWIATVCSLAAIHDQTTSAVSTTKIGAEAEVPV